MFGWVGVFCCFVLSFVWGFFLGGGGIFLFVRGLFGCFIIILGLVVWLLGVGVGGERECPSLAGVLVLMPGQIALLIYIFFTPKLCGLIYSAL